MKIILCFLMVIWGRQLEVVAQQLPQGINVLGKVEKYFPFGTVSEGSISVPLLIHFSSVSERNYGFLPSGWLFPLLDSVAYKDSESSVNFTTPWGDEFSLNLNPSTGQVTGNIEWKGAVKGDRIQLVETGEDGEELRALVYKKGKIYSLSKGKTEWRWVRNTAGETERIVSSNTGLSILKFDRKQEGLNHAITVDYKGELLELKYLKSDLVNIGEQHKGLAFGMTDIIWNDRKWELEQKKESLKINGEISEYFAWREDGAVVKIGDMDVEVFRPIGQPSTVPGIRIRGKDSLELIKRPYYLKNGVAVYYNEDGSLERHVYSVSANSGKRILRKSEFVSQTGKVKRTYIAFRDAEGNILRDQAGEFRREFKNGKYHVYKNGVLIRVY